MAVMLSVIRQMPGNYLILYPDSPRFTIAEASENYNQATFTKRTAIIGKGVFEVFPDDPADPGADGVRNLAASLLQVIETGKSSEMSVQKYPVYKPGTSGFEEKYWLPFNKPVIIDGKVALIIHSVEDITENRLLRISEEYFRALADEAPFMVWRSVGGACNYVNKAWSEFTGLSLEASLGEGHLQAFYPDDIPEQRAIFTEALHNRSSYESRYRLRRKDGQVRWVYMKASPHIVDSRTIEYIGSLVDITESELARQVVEEREARFRSVLETLPQLTWTNTEAGEITFFNQQWYSYTGLDFDSTKRLGWQGVVHPDDLQSTVDQLWNILKNGCSGEFENRYRRADGEYRWHLNRIAPCKDRDDLVELWVGTATDIHDLKRLQQQKDDFISIASHELKTPVTSLMGAMQLLERMNGNHNLKVLPAMISQAYRNAKKVNELISNLLNVSQLNEGQLRLTKTRFNVAAMIEDCRRNYRFDNEHELIQLGDPELNIVADEGRIEQVVVNFINNAIKYAPESKQIFLKCERENAAVKISVTDTGPGIASEKVPHLFERYFRIDSKGSQYGGLGLGLYICAEIIKQHDGQYGVESESGEGSTFWFTLPAEV